IKRSPKESSMMHLVPAVLCLAAFGACASKAQPPTSQPPASESASPSAVEPAQQAPTPVEKAPAGSAAPASGPGETSTAPPAPAPPPPAPAPEPPAPGPAANKPAPASGTGALLAAETAAWDRARPVLQKHCANCHTKGSRGATKKKLDHFDMTTYPVGGHHAAHIATTIRAVLGLSGKRATMPSGKPGSVTGDDLAAIKAWTDAWEAADKAGAHRTGGDPHPR
ncbi:MAG TPA: c-type cytochrome, partial [Kofleriaceae bacterium]|nr:c-type cytochrome [Kofleriaceae bacterium]